MIREGAPPIRPLKGDTINISELIEENKNLKRLLKLVKKHVSYDRSLYEEIKKAIIDENYKITA
jgi:hypothetical protein